MNLIELSNQLKDVPDQFLLKEVQAPSGAYPAYMVVTELTRRKRMRESAAKEMPETTVAEDLVGEQERARAMAQVKNQQAQPMIPSQERLNAPSMGAMGGLGALPEAQGSLAAQDAMGTTPPEMMMPVQGMAGGGMVSFKGGGEVPRYRTGELIDIYPAMGLDIDPETGEPYKSINPLDFGRFLRGGKSIEEYYKEKPRTVGTAGGDAESQRGGFYGGAPKVAAASAAAPSPSAVTPATASSPELTRLKQLSAPIKLPTEEELAARAATGETQFAEKVPYRFGFLEDQLKSEAEKLRGREQSNINEALIQAGLGIMGSKSPRFLGAVSEGGLAALRAYKEGQKDIRESERALVQSRIKAAEAQSLYDKDKFAAGDKKRAQSLEYAKTAADLNSTESANVARVLQGQATLARESRELAKLPYEVAESVARAKSYENRSGLTDADQKAADEYARAGAVMKGMPGTPAYEAEYNRLYQQALVRRSLTPGQTAPATSTPMRGTYSSVMGQ